MMKIGKNIRYIKILAKNSLGVRRKTYDQVQCPYKWQIAEP